MEIVALVLNIASLIFDIVLAAVAYQFFKAAYNVLKPRLRKMNKRTWLFRVSYKKVIACFICCFLALAI